MKKIIQLIGGAFVAAILVIAVTVIYQNQIIPRLKTDAFKNTEKETDFRDERAFYEAVSYHPVFEYTGGTAQKTVIAYDENNKATAASVEYSVLKDICVTDKKDDYEKTLAEAVEENRIRNGCNVHLQKESQSVFPRSVPVYHRKSLQDRLP